MGTTPGNRLVYATIDTRYRHKGTGQFTCTVPSLVGRNTHNISRQKISPLRYSVRLDNRPGIHRRRCHMAGMGAAEKGMAHSSGPESSDSNSRGDPPCIAANIDRPYSRYGYHLPELLYGAGRRTLQRQSHSRFL